MDQLVNYSDSDSDDLENEREPHTREQTSEDDNESPSDPRLAVSRAQPPAKRPKIESVALQETLSLPPAILSMFNDDKEEARDTGADHQGRVRSFPHCRGNWSTHVFVAMEFTAQQLCSVSAFQQSLQKHFSGYNFYQIPPTDLHVSLSRTVPIQHHWIDPLMDSLRSKFKERKPFNVGFGDIAFYVNDERTRSFVGLDVVYGYDEITSLLVQMCSLVRDVDQCFAAFKLPAYYKDPSFHASLYWCLGDIKASLQNRDKAILQEEWCKLLGRRNVSESEQVAKLSVEEARCKTGNKLYSFHFSN